MKRVKKECLRFRVKLVLGWLVLAAGLMCKNSQADEVYTFVLKKQEEKPHWSLSDWLDQRDRMRVQDIWLSMHSPTPYEFYLGGTYQFDQTQGASTFNAGSFDFAAFATAFGIEAHYTLGLDNQFVGLFDFRILGPNEQATNVTFQLGIRNDDGAGNNYRNFVLGASFALYFARFFGMEGIYRHFFASTPTTTLGSVSGDRYQAGAFLDFSFFRLYGDYFWDLETSSNVTGAIAGVKLFF